MKRYISVITIVILFILFCIFIILTKCTNKVLNVLSPITFQIDMNANGIVDDNETFCIPDTETFVYGTRAPDFARNLDIRTLIAMEYLADEFAKNQLLLNNVKVKKQKGRTPDCRYAEIYIDNQKYSDIIIKAGFAKRDNEFNAVKYLKNIEKAQKQNLVILNHKSYKYHKLDCEYGLQSHDYTVIQRNQLPKEAKPCKFCHFSNNMHQNSNSNVETVITDGSIKIIFPDFSKHPVPDTKCDTTVCKTLVEEINKANKSIDMALYGFGTVPDVLNAIEAAKNRNVRIRLVYDRHYLPGREYYKNTPDLANLANESLSDYITGQPANTNKLMHNKFIIFDNKTVFTGSMNISKTGLSDYNANTVVIIKSEDVANLYSKEFEQMLSGKFHNAKTPLNIPNQFNISGSKISIYFSPYDKTSEYIIQIINNAKDYIYIPTFVITHHSISNALINAKRRGVDVKILMEAANTTATHTKHEALRKAGIQLKTETFAGKMHSKTMIIDDKYIITGSMNFSNSGENMNDENCLIIENQKLAKFSKKFFMYLWDQVSDYWLTHNAYSEGKDSPGSCADGTDNDFDGKIDGEDPNCASSLK